MAGTATPEGEVRRAEILAYMQAFQKSHQYMPTIAELATKFDMHRTAVIWHLGVLRTEGTIWYQDGKIARSLKLTARKR